MRSKYSFNKLIDEKNPINWQRTKTLGKPTRAFWNTPSKKRAKNRSHRDNK